ncbi:MAG: hypothetical protein VB066_12130 [Paludibacter sp.]|nr:hypothetical protein [Paludibacter sp.]
MTRLKSDMFSFVLMLFGLICYSNNGYGQIEQITIDKSDTVIDCKGGLFNDGKPTYIVISSKKTTNGWIQTKNITIQNCRINGAIRIVGLGVNGQAEEVKQSSLYLGHTERAQAIAPTNIKISNVIINGVSNKTLLYLAPGTTYVTVENSTFSGENTGSGPVIYFDAESGHNTFRNNTFTTKANREVIACDGSAYNIIDGNKFENVVKGGMYLYRNCGEGGTVRHQTPNHNTIINNTFNLSALSLGNYGIWLGSRNGNRSYCDADDGYPFGSSIDNRDFADNNIVNANIFEGASSKTVEINNSGQNNQINSVSAVNETNINDEPTVVIANRKLVFSNIGGECFIRVFDLAGRILIRKMLTDNIVELSLATNEVCFVQIMNGDKIWTKKIIVK